MRSCPICSKKIKEDGRCTNVVCKGYSSRVLDAIEDGSLECICCGNNNATNRLQNTRYEEESRNWCVLCPTCQESQDEYWSDMWFDYYSGCM